MILLRRNDCNWRILVWLVFEFIHISKALTESAVASLITIHVGIVAVLISKFKCLVQCDGCCTIKSLKFGCLDNSLVDEHNVEFLKKYCKW